MKNLKLKFVSYFIAAEEEDQEKEEHCGEAGDGCDALAACENEDSGHYGYQNNAGKKSCQKDSLSVHLFCASYLNVFAGAERGCILCGDGQRVTGVSRRAETRSGACVTFACVNDAYRDFSS